MAFAKNNPLTVQLHNGDTLQVLNSQVGEYTVKLGTRYDDVIYSASRPDTGCTWKVVKEVGGDDYSLIENGLSLNVASRHDGSFPVSVWKEE